MGIAELGSSVSGVRAGGHTAHAYLVCSFVMWLGLLVALAPLTYAGLPDPSWIEGIFDDADFDDVATAETSKDSAVTASLISDLLPPCRVLARFRLADGGPI